MLHRESSCWCVAQVKILVDYHYLWLLPLGERFVKCMWKWNISENISRRLAEEGFH